MPSSSSRFHDPKRQQRAFRTTLLCSTALAAFLLLGQPGWITETLAATASLVEIAAPPAAQGSLSDGTYTGPAVDAYFGNVQVQVTIKDGKITAIKPIKYPADRSRSRQINDRALPILEREVISAQRIDVDFITGATLTCQAYLRSLFGAMKLAVH